MASAGAAELTPQPWRDQPVTGAQKGLPLGVSGTALGIEPIEQRGKVRIQAAERLLQPEVGGLVLAQQGNAGGSQVAT